MLRRIALLTLLVAATPSALAAPPEGSDAGPAAAATADSDAPDAADTDVAATDVAAAPPPAPAEPPPLDDELGRPLGTVDIMASFLRTMLMLGVVLALVWLTLSKGMGKIVERAQAGKRVKVLERIALDARRSLFLVEVDGKQFVLGGGDIVRLHEITPENRPFTSVLTTASAQPPLTTPAPAQPPFTATTPAPRSTTESA